MPPALACRFTTGELAVLRIVGDEVRAGGPCALCIDAIAARAGVCRRLAQNAIRQAARLGLLTIQERRRAGAGSRCSGEERSATLRRIYRPYARVYRRW